MSDRPLHGADRYAICNAASGSRLIETRNNRELAIVRANTLTRQLRKPIEVKDRADPDPRGRSTVIYATGGYVTGGHRQAKRS